MKGVQSLDSVVAEARKSGLGPTSVTQTPVLLVLPEAITLDGDTVSVNGEIAAAAPASFDVPGTLVVPVQRRFAKSKEPKISFGRSTVCDVVLAYTPVSKHHGDFEDRLGVWHLTDVGSTNGTILDGRKVGPAGAMLRSRSVLQIGHIFAQFLEPAAFAEFLRHKL